MVDQISAEDLRLEQGQIEKAFKSLLFGQKMRYAELSCMQHCKGEVAFPFVLETEDMPPKDFMCFSNCLNIKLEKGPFLSELGPIPEGSIPKKFVWTTGLTWREEEEGGEEE